MRLIDNAIYHHACHITVFRTISHIRIAEPPLIHTFLHGKVEHRLLFTVIYTGDACQVGLLIVGFQFINYIHRQVLQARLYIAPEELFAVHHDFLQLFAVNRHIAVIIDFRTGQFLHQFFQHRPFRRAIGRGTVHQRIFHHLHLRRFRHYHSLVSHNALQKFIFISESLFLILFISFKINFTTFLCVIQAKSLIFMFFIFIKYKFYRNTCKSILSRRF